MGLWIFTAGTDCKAHTRLNSLKILFDVFQRSPFSVSVLDSSDDFQLIHGSWADPRDNDFFHYTSGDRPGFNRVIMDGYVTELGKFGPVNSSQERFLPELLKLWNVHGDDLLPEINGSYALLFVNEQDKTVVCCSDRLSSRPVWFSADGSRFHFGNNPGLLAFCRSNTTHLDPVGVWSLFAAGRAIGAHGLFDEIRKIGAARIARWRAGSSLAFSTWWKSAYVPDREANPADWGGRIAEALGHSVRRVLAVSPAPHLFLSGGLDSRIAAAALGSQSKAVTLCSGKNVEARLAKYVAGILGLEHETIVRGSSWYQETMEVAGLLAGGNYNLFHSHFIMPVSLVRRKCPEASFFLGDLLENFNKHYFRANAIRSDRVDPAEISERYSVFYNYGHPNPRNLLSLFRPSMTGRMHSAWKEEVVRLYRLVGERSSDYRDRLDLFFRWADVSATPTFHMIGGFRPFGNERNLMYDNSMIDLLLTVPADERSRGGLHVRTLLNLKPVLSLVPDANYWLPPIVPRSFQKTAETVRPFIGKARRYLHTALTGRTSMSTEGSWPLLGLLLRFDREYRNSIDTLLRCESAFPPDLFDAKVISSCWRNYLDGSDEHYYEICMLISFGILHRKLKTSGIAI